MFERIEIQATRHRATSNQRTKREEKRKRRATAVWRVHLRASRLRVFFGGPRAAVVVRQRTHMARVERGNAVVVRTKVTHTTRVARITDDLDRVPSDLGEQPRGKARPETALPVSPCISLRGRLGYSMP